MDLRRGKARRAVSIALGFVLAAVLLFVFFRNTDWSGVASAIRGAGIGLLALALLGHAASLAIRTVRWQILLRPVKADVPFGSAWRHFVVGFAVTTFLPGRMGELLRPFLLAREQRVPFASTFATVVAERVIDLVAVLAMLGTIYLFPAALGSHAGDRAIASQIGVVKGFGLVALGVAGGMAAFLAVLRLRTDFVVRIVERIARPLPGRVSDLIVRMTRAFAQGLGSLRSGREAAGVAGTTVLTWLVLGTSYYVTLHAFGIVVPYHHVFFLMAVQALGVVVPTPAGAGTFHAAAIVVVGEIWGLNETMASAVAAYAIVSHLLAFLPIVLFGVFHLVRDGVDVFAAADEAQKADRPPG